MFLTQSELDGFNELSKISASSYKRRLEAGQILPQIEKNNPKEIIIKEALLDTSALKESTNIVEYRPKTMDEYIGQENAKNKLKDLREGSIEHNKPFGHLLISGYSGTGKTLLSTILANQLNKKIVFTTGGELKTEQIFIDKLVESDGGVIYIDEANMLPKKVGFFMLPMMETYKLGDKQLKNFSVFFITTHKGDLAKELDALIQRCETIELQPYNDNEMLKIIKQYSKKEFDKVLSDDIYDLIVKNCRQVPRIAKNLVKNYVYTKDWNKVKIYNNIVKDGLTTTDIKVLNYLNSNGGASKINIASFIRTKSQSYEYDIEPYLIYKNLIEVANKRKITEKGKDFLRCLKS